MASRIRNRRLVPRQTPRRPPCAMGPPVVAWPPHSWHALRSRSSVMNPSKSDFQPGFPRGRWPIRECRSPGRDRGTNTLKASSNYSSSSGRANGRCRNSPIALHRQRLSTAIREGEVGAGRGIDARHTFVSHVDHTWATFLEGSPCEANQPATSGFIAKSTRTVGIPYVELWPSPRTCPNAEPRSEVL
jgi:hypothetical protein